MSMFTVMADTAAPAAAEAAQPNSLMSFLPLILIFGVMIFFMMRSQKKQAQKRQQMIDKVVKGTRILLQSGMYGTVVEVRSNSFVVEIADKVCVEVVKNGIADLAADPKQADVKA